MDLLQARASDDEKAIATDSAATCAGTEADDASSGSNTSREAGSAPERLEAELRELRSGDEAVALLTTIEEEINHLRAQLCALIPLPPHQRMGDATGPHP